MSDWSEKRLPKLVCLKMQCKSQEINGALHAIKSKWLTLTFHFASQSALLLLAISFCYSECRHSTLKVNSCCQMCALLKQKDGFLWEVNRFNQAAAVKTCFWNAFLNFLLWRLEKRDEPCLEGPDVFIHWTFYRPWVGCQTIRRPGTEVRRCTMAGCYLKKLSV